MRKLMLAQLACSVVLIACTPRLSEAATFKTLYSIPGSNDGAAPEGTLITFGDKLYGTTSSGGKYLAGSVYSIDPKTSATATIHSFPPELGGANPNAGLVEVNGVLYGTNASGGAVFGGNVFAMDPKTGSTTVLYSFPHSVEFSPPSALCYSNGRLYGTLPYGGTTGNGEVFSVDPTTGVEATVYSFTGGADGANPNSGVISVGSIIYGTASHGGLEDYGTIFAVSPQSETESTIYQFQGGAAGQNPFGGLTYIGGNLYGTTSGLVKGTVFSFDPSHGTEKTLYQFTGGTDAAEPESTLIYLNGNLYGTSIAGGDYGDGAVYKVNLATGSEAVVYSFTGNNDGAYPLAGLASVAGAIYGVAEIAGAYNSGNVYSIDTRSNAEKTVHQFNGSYTVDAAALSGLGNLLYATIVQGGSLGGGSVAVMNPSSGSVNTIYSFTGGENGYGPESSLIRIGKELYGIAQRGMSGGNVFKVNPETGSEHTLYSFPNDSDAYAGSLINLKGRLLGVTQLGGANGYGSIFEINTKTGIEQTLYSFTGGSDGGNSGAAMTNINGQFYGTTSEGGAFGLGVVFQFNPSTNSEVVLYSFGSSPTDAEYPFVHLLDVGGLLYGTAPLGGAYGNGAIFSVNPTTGAEKVLYSFGSEYSLTGLVRRGSKLYGTTYFGGGSNHGSIFDYDLSTGVEKTIHSFKESKDGRYVQRDLVNIGDVLYGTTQFGGAHGRGTVFSLAP